MKKIKWWLREIKWWFQRRIRGYSDYDLWNVDYFLSNFIIRILKDFKDKQHGYPGMFTEESWNKEIDDMIKGFEVFNKFANNDISYSDKEYKESILNASKFILHFNDLWD